MSSEDNVKRYVGPELARSWCCGLPGSILLTSVHPLLIHWTSISLLHIPPLYIKYLDTKSMNLKFILSWDGNSLWIANLFIGSWDHKLEKESVAYGWEKNIHKWICISKVRSILQTSTSNFSMPGSREEWPASGTMWRLISGKACHIYQSVTARTASNK